MFKLLGVLALAYTAYCAWRGEVFAKSGAWGKSFTREQSPGRFWAAIATYGVLGLALLTIF